MPPGLVPTACIQMNVLRTREVRSVPTGSGKARQADKGKGGLKIFRKSYWLIVLRDRESLSQV